MLNKELNGGSGIGEVVGRAAFGRMYVGLSSEAHFLVTVYMETHHLAQERRKHGRVRYHIHILHVLLLVLNFRLLGPLIDLGWMHYVLSHMFGLGKADTHISNDGHYRAH